MSSLTPFDLLWITACVSVVAAAVSVAALTFALCYRLIRGSK